MESGNTDSIYTKNVMHKKINKKKVRNPVRDSIIPKEMKVAHVSGNNNGIDNTCKPKKKCLNICKKNSYDTKKQDMASLNPHSIPLDDEIATKNLKYSEAFKAFKSHSNRSGRVKNDRVALFRDVKTKIRNEENNCNKNWKSDFNNNFPKLPSVRNSKLTNENSDNDRRELNSAKKSNLDLSFSEVVKRVLMSKICNDEENEKNVQEVEKMLQIEKDLTVDKFKTDQSNRPLNSKREKLIKRKENRSLRTYINGNIKRYTNGKKIGKLSEFSDDIHYLKKYAEHLVECGLGYIVDEIIRINRKNNRQSFISMSSNSKDGSHRDAVIMIPAARQYAMEGDLVRAFVFYSNTSADRNSKDNKTDKDDEVGSKETGKTPDNDDYVNNTITKKVHCVGPSESPRAFVISILNQVERKVVGYIRFNNAIEHTNGLFYYKLKPNDIRLPIINIEMRSCELHIKNIKNGNDQNNSEEYLFMVKILFVNSYGWFYGELLEYVGKSCELNSETKAILIRNDLCNIKPYDKRIESLFTDTNDSSVIQKELAYREDLRKKCIFTIDPVTAKDLDDAISIDTINDNKYEVGVHIADVSFYLAEYSEVDNILTNRTTSIYLVNEVLHMLPQTLCMKCSLLPGEDKLTISIFWCMNKNGIILGEPRISRSIIKSCTQLSYEHVDALIKHGEKKINKANFPLILNGFKLCDIVKRIKVLHKMTKTMRAKRFENGSLSLDNLKLYFEINNETGEPISYKAAERTDAHYLIEELMIVANATIGDYIYKKYPDMSILRNHAPPMQHQLDSLCAKLEKYDMKLDATNSKTLSQSIKNIVKSSKHCKKAVSAGLNSMLIKTMSRASYFCSDGVRYENFTHYALNIPIYTHFTSPIRRYPDILVHRLLCAALNYAEPPKRTVGELQKILKVCNTQKFNAQNAGDASRLVNFLHCLRASKSVHLSSIVVDMSNKFLTVLSIETGHCFDVHYKQQKVKIDHNEDPFHITIQEPNSIKSPMKLKLLSLVTVKVIERNNNLLAYFSSPDRKQRLQNNRLIPDPPDDNNDNNDNNDSFMHY